MNDESNMMETVLHVHDEVNMGICPSQMVKKTLNCVCNACLSKSLSLSNTVLAVAYTSFHP